ncbi:gamma-glutamyltransferase [Pedosphaera parvula]|uniref:Glutathione hydrolase proenzyme n=1 Tax=Pedosphaera parvula (strain Ellin514) TaxID=320771 RepID=B9XM48_PEDPL|nr:gamma-glutamyltransferase [Pedosphaera parvula]EEF59041.1 gamma-glutamyltransferase [Pedosphaera parvula Ellin514]
MRAKDQWFFTILLVVLWPGMLLAQDRTQARSMVISRRGVVATESPLASQAGATILAKGGNAVDAAIAANAVMGVVSPMMNGMGGDMFAIIYEAKTKKLYGINASGWTPARLTREELQKRGTTEMPKTGIDCVTVPGVVDGWEKMLKRFGKKKLSTLLEPAISYAEDGYPVTEMVSIYWKDSEELLRNDKNATHTYLPNNHPLAVGEVFRNPDLAWSLKQLASHGRKAFYEGEIAKRLVAYSARMGGTMTMQDLAKYSSEWVEPISTTYRGWTVYEMPPNGQGIAALEMLNVMEKFPLWEYGHNSAKALHVMIEAKKLAYADMLRYVADPKFSQVPATELLSKSYALKRAVQIDEEHANCEVEAGKPLEPGKDTTYLCVVDAEGNMVSFIQSNYSSFGSGLVADGTGFVLHNRGALFSLDPGSPNVLAGHKRPLHTIIPAMMAKGDVRIAFGIMGGWNQSQAHAQFVSNVVDHNMNVQAALEAPRFTKLTFDNCDVQFEGRIPHEVREELAAKGHDIYLRGDFTQSVGGGQAVMRDFGTGVNYGASDPRKDGAAIPQPLD